MKPLALNGAVPAKEVFVDEKQNDAPKVIYDPKRQVHVIHTDKGIEEASRHPGVIAATQHTPTISGGGLDDEDVAAGA